MVNCDKEKCDHYIETKLGGCCCIPFDNTVHECKFTPKDDEESE